jgi:hypothetical protein
LPGQQAYCIRSRQKLYDQEDVPFNQSCSPYNDLSVDEQPSMNAGKEGFINTDNKEDIRETLVLLNFSGKRFLFV